MFSTCTLSGDASCLHVQCDTNAAGDMGAMQLNLKCKGTRDSLQHSGAHITHACLGRLQAHLLVTRMPREEPTQAPERSRQVSRATRYTNASAQVASACRQQAELGAHPEDLLHRVHALAEHVNAKLLKSRPGDAGVKVHTLKQAVNLNGGGG